MRFLSFTFFVFFTFKAQALTCAETTLINLSDKGSSLENLRVTDQNGIGICHIEQLHKMLKAKMIGNVDLSRIQLAIVEKKVRDEKLENKKAIRWMKNTTAIGGLYMDAGNSCEAYKLLKGQEICLAEHDRYEQLSLEKPQHQMEILGRMAKFFDGRPENSASPFLDLISQSPEELDPFIRSCPIPEDKFTEIKTEYISYLSSTKKEDLLAMAQSLTPQSFYMKRGTTIKDHIAEVFKDLPQKTELFEKTTKLMLESEKCIVLGLNQTEKMCSLLKPREKSLLTLTSLGAELNEVIDVIQGSSDRDQFFAEAFKCDPQNKRKIPNLTCTTKDLRPMIKQVKSFDDLEMMVDKKIQELLVRQTPVGISTCTRFFKNPKAQTLNLEDGSYNCGDKKAPDFEKNEGSHAVTIIGSRCKDGAKEYLIQNSWGDGCAYYKDYECTNKGGFWAPSSVVIKNIRNINYLE